MGHNCIRNSRSIDSKDDFMASKNSMGLAIIHFIISAHGGKLDCMNNPDGSVTFYFGAPISATK